MMTLRNLLVALIVAATAAFVIATSIERSTGESGHHEAAANVKPAAAAAKPVTTDTRAPAGGESAATHAKEGAVRPVVAAHAVTSEAHPPASGESAATHAKEGPVTPAGMTERPHAELRPLGINVEPWPFVLIAALASLALATGARLGPSLAPVLGFVVVAMLAFAALDVGEVVHQSDIDKTLLTLLAGVVAALRLTAAVVATALARRTLRARPRPRPHPPAGTMPA